MHVGIITYKAKREPGNNGSVPSSAPATTSAYQAQVCLSPLYDCTPTHPSHISVPSVSVLSLLPYIQVPRYSYESISRLRTYSPKKNLRSEVWIAIRSLPVALCWLSGALLSKPPSFLTVNGQNSFPVAIDAHLHV
jgi:hypothetical protein